MANKTKIKTVYKIKWKNLFKVLTILLILMILGIVINFVLSNYKDYKQINKIKTNLSEKIIVSNLVDDANVSVPNQNESLSKFDPYWNYIKLSLLETNLSELKKINSSSVGYIEVKGTNISYPILFNETDYYKKHDFNKNENRFGWIYTNTKSETLDKNTIILGNNNYCNILFGELNNLFKKTWEEDNNNYIIKYMTANYSALFQIISIQKVKDISKIKTNYEDLDMYNEYLQNTINNSLYDFNTVVNSEDNIITLIGISSKDNIVVTGKLIKIKTENN